MRTLFLSSVHHRSNNCNKDAAAATAAEAVGRSRQCELDKRRACLGKESKSFVILHALLPWFVHMLGTLKRHVEQALCSGSRRTH